MILRESALLDALVSTMQQHFNFISQHKQKLEDSCKLQNASGT